MSARLDRPIPRPAPHAATTSQPVLSTPVEDMPVAVPPAAEDEQVVGS
ncbi:MAG: hypothetical protein HKM95_01900 [Inquilinus sp.]|nr:hypothetical protein [Inquilinus sp.]